ncbi:MAG: tRNA (N6-threonylcarbamoyladenosine(37)-N6)-methyltransferase TrmO [Clostridia bacterium]|nr:tRNA (N6-threonylcarbamoyladenosine(37)-N6)-methyltransferase TrmO [Clostridia bacterium]
MKIIARIHTDFKEKFGIPRQSGIAADTVGRIVFEPEYRVPEALRGIEEYSHLWLIWNFSEAEREGWRPTVRPPRLGGNKRMGVFATRSPFRPNPIGLSSVRLLSVEDSAEGRVLIVAGADILDGTPIYDIKPYLAYTDSHPDAVCGFADGVMDYSVGVEIPEELKKGLSAEYLSALVSILSGDPRPSYKEDGERIYGMVYGDYEVKFTVSDGVLSVCEITKIRR